MMNEKELAENIEWVFHASPVKYLNGSEFPKSEKDLITQVEEYFESIGGKVEREGLGIVVLNRRGIRSSIAHGIGRLKSIAFAAVPDVIMYGRIIDHRANWKNRGYDTYVIDAPIKIGTKTYIVEVIIINEDDKNNFYLHEVEIKEKAQSAFKTGVVTGALQAPQKTQSAFKTGVVTSALQASKLMITQKLKEIN